MKRIAAVSGQSGSGKTTLITDAVRQLAARGRSVSVIKHTHHVLNEERRGDTEAFLAAGADLAVLAGENEAVFFESASARRVRYHSIDELIAHIDTDSVLIEGFQSVDRFPRLHLSETRRVAAAELIALLDRIDRR